MQGRNGKTDHDWQLAREGIKLLLNNNISEAEKLFREKKDNVQMAAGYCFVTFMVSRLTLHIALTTLHSFSELTFRNRESYI
jgi:hypothetical protein